MSIYIRSLGKGQKLAAVLVLWIYIPFLVMCLGLLGISGILYVRLGLYLCCSAVVLATSKRISAAALIFLLIYSVLIAINALLVSYSYYVLTEGIPSLFIVAVPIFAVSDKSFDTKYFFDKWMQIAVWSTPIVLFLIVLEIYKVVDYSVFTDINPYNVLALCIGLFIRKDSPYTNKLFLHFLIWVNAAAIVLLGSRMNGAATLGIYIISWFFSGKLSKGRKILLFLLLLTAAFLAAYYIYDIVFWLQTQLAEFGIRSRSLTLLVQMLKTKEILSSGRDYITEACFSYASNRLYLPCGLGVTLYVTDGAFYFPHNMFLQMLVIFGGVGVAVVILAIIYRYAVFRKKNPSISACIGLIYISCLLLSLTTVDMLTHVMFVLPSAFIFFYKKLEPVLSGQPDSHKGTVKEVT